MEYIIILIICLSTVFILKFAFNIKIKDFNKIKQIGYDKQLNEITNKLPTNKEVCEQILKKLKNDNVKIQINDDKNSELSYYMAINNNIIIANINNTFTRIQTIAHECLHSIQDRRILLFNFIFSNIYILYFVAIVLLTIFRVIKSPMLFLIILIILGIIYYAVRSYLETDAMTKAPYLAREYINEQEILEKEQVETILKNYEELNKVGIPMTNFQLLLSVLSKIIMYIIISLIITNI